MSCFLKPQFPLCFLRLKMKKKPFWIGVVMKMMDLIQAHFQIQISTEAPKNQIMKIWKIKLGMFLPLVALRIWVFSF